MRPTHPEDDRERARGPVARERRSGRDRRRDRRGELSAALVVAEERERRRIAGGLHDQVGQLLGVARIKLGEALAAEEGGVLSGPVGEARQLVEQALREIRALSFDLSSPVLHELGVAAALSALAEQMERRHGLRCRCELPLEVPPLSESLALLLYSIARELLWNVVKHAAAREAVLALSVDGPVLEIVVRDDGVGFRPATGLAAVTERGGLGLFHARRRLEALDGSLGVQPAAGAGTEVVLRVPWR